MSYVGIEKEENEEAKLRMVAATSRQNFAYLSPKEKKFVIVSNLRRRQLTDNQKLKYAKDLIEIYSELAKQKQIEAGKYDVEGGRENTKPLLQKNSKGFQSKKV